VISIFDVEKSCDNVCVGLNDGSLSSCAVREPRATNAVRMMRSDFIAMFLWIMSGIESEQKYHTIVPWDPRGP
jgi:hypothetical protein